MILGREPALILAAIQAIIALGIGFGLQLTGEQVALIIAAVGAVFAVITRQQSTPVNSPRLPMGTTVVAPGGQAGVVTPTEPIR
jgi:hypothetical protein